MRRVLRIFFNTLTVLSLLLCVATVVVWVRSHYLAEAFGIIHDLHDREVVEHHAVVLYSSRGRLMLVSKYVAHEKRYGSSREALDLDLWNTFAQQKSGAPGGNWRMRRKDGTWAIMFPHWSFAVVTGLLPSYLVIKAWRRRRAKAPGHCSSCGYDLRATPDRCPECGAVPKGFTA